MAKKILSRSIVIQAPAEKLWHVLLDDATYRQWTSVFHPGSCAESDWKEGSKVLFKTPEGDGMVSKVAVSKPYEEISFQHLGVLKDNVEYIDDKATEWQGFETYRLKPIGNATELSIEQDLEEKHMEWFGATWDKALQKVKEIAEANVTQAVNM
jgi:uncharacterized protein YndB with AHSA1/START domain